MYKQSRIKVIKSSLQNSRWKDYYCDYDYDNWKPPISRINWIKTQIGDATNKSILDVGCGAHPVTESIVAKEKVGLDISLKAAEKVEDHFDKLYIADLNYLRRNYCEELLGKFDYVIAGETLEHFENIQEIIYKLKWFLKPEGKLIITYPNHYSLSMYIDYFIHGLKYKRYKDFMEGHFTFFNLNQLRFLFDSACLGIVKFDYRACDIIKEKFPNEDNSSWRKLVKIDPSLLAHQFFFTLKPESEHKCFGKRFQVVIRNGVRTVKMDI
ncbi:MAG: hypothetical protein QG570_321 [Patescibacteria group bacterium]|nr:hypothetical protein [Patescibacteria group bacterium]